MSRKNRRPSASSPSEGQDAVTEDDAPSAPDPETPLVVVSTPPLAGPTPPPLLPVPPTWVAFECGACSGTGGNPLETCHRCNGWGAYRRDLNNLPVLERAPAPAWKAKP